MNEGFAFDAASRGVHRLSVLSMSSEAIFHAFKDIVVGVFTSEMTNDGVPPRFAFTVAASNLLEGHNEFDPQACIDCMEAACHHDEHNGSDV